MYKFHPAAMCDINQTNGTRGPQARESLDVQLSRDQLGLTIQVNDDKHYDLTVYRYDGTILLGRLSFSESYALALPNMDGEKILILIDGETIPYVL